jgi:hypothetical protein
MKHLDFDLLASGLGAQIEFQLNPEWSQTVSKGPTVSSNVEIDFYPNSLVRRLCGPGLKNP